MLTKAGKKLVNAIAAIFLCLTLVLTAAVPVTTAEVRAEEAGTLWAPTIEDAAFTLEEDHTLSLSFKSRPGRDDDGWPVTNSVEIYDGETCVYSGALSVPPNYYTSGSSLSIQNKIAASNVNGGAGFEWEKTYTIKVIASTELETQENAVKLTTPKEPVEYHINLDLPKPGEAPNFNVTGPDADKVGIMYAVFDESSYAMVCQANDDYKKYVIALVSELLDLHPEMAGAIPNRNFASCMFLLTEGHPITEGKVSIEKDKVYLIDIIIDAKKSGDVYVNGEKMNGLSFSHLYGVEDLKATGVRVSLETDYRLRVNADNFPDPAFRDYISKKIDTGSYEDSGILTKAEIAAVTEIPTIAGCNDYTGIENFANLGSLSIQNSNLTKLDLSGNAMLTSLTVTDCPQLTEVIFAKKMNLESMTLSGCSKLQSLNLSGCTALKTLDITEDSFDELDISNTLVCRDAEALLKLGKQKSSDGTSKNVRVIMNCEQKKLFDERFAESNPDIIADPDAKHSETTEITPATTTANGKKVTKCAICGEVFKTSTIYAAKTVKLSATKYTYDGKYKKPSVIIKDSKGNPIAASNYKVTYASGRKAVGSYSVTVTFKENYKGSKKLTFKINPATPVIKSLTPGNGKLTVKASTKPSLKGASYFQIAYKQKGTSKWKYASTSSVSKTLSKLKKEKTYYVKMRAYKTVSDTKYYSAWTKTKLSKPVK